MKTRRSTRLEIKSESPAPSIASTDEPEEQILCPWVQLSPTKFPPLVLPESSSDLLIESEILFPAIEIYETCISYYRILQVSPFLFEDFCCALRSPDQTRLLAEIHIAFIRLFFRDDEENQVTFTAQDASNYYNVMLQLMDGMTYAEVLRLYLESDPRFDCANIIQILGENYPFVDVEKRITVLKWLCDFFLDSYSYRQLITNEGLLTYDDCCRACGKPGDVLLCDGCEACYHVECTGLEEVPAERWFCDVCHLHQASDAIAFKDLANSMLKHRYRISPLGYDRHGRVYWFLVKRILVQDTDNTSIYYYSTLPQFYELIKQLDPDHYEKELCANLKDNFPEIERLMRITLKLTRKYRDALVAKIGANRDTPYSYLDVDNSFRMANIVTELTTSGMKMGVDVGNVNMDENMKVDMNGHGDADESFVAVVRKHLYLDGSGHLSDVFWSGSLQYDDLINLQRNLLQELKLQAVDTPMIAMKSDNLQRGYRLAFSDGHYRDYQNQFAVNELAKSTKQRNKERDKKKYLSARFSLSEEGEFTWVSLKGRDIYSSESNVCKIIALNVKKLAERIPDELMHRLWRQEKHSFIERLIKSTTPSDLRYMILQLERAIRKPVFSNIWWNSLGITRLMRTTSDDREEKSKFDALRKKEEKALQSADPSVDGDVVFVKYLKPKPNPLWRIRDESYRLSNRHQMGGWLWFSSTLVRDFQKPAGPAPRGIDYFKPVNDETPVVVRKAINLFTIVKRLSMWRDSNERREGALNGHLLCYSSQCLYNPLGFSFTLNCYNPCCPRLICDYDTKLPVKAYKGGLRTEPRPPNKAMILRKSVQGEGLPFPFPKPLTFTARKSKKRSLFILPQAVLKRLARQGGLNTAQSLPGFNKQAKTNTTVWNYPSNRPVFDNCWRFLTLNSNTLHALALNLRVMFSCVRWSEMQPNDESDGRVTTHLPDHDERRLVTSHKEHAPDGYYEQYKLRVQILSLEDEGTDEDASTSYRAGGGVRTSTRKRKSVKPKTPTSTKRHISRTDERWIDGVELRPFEIAHYWKRFNTAMQTTNAAAANKTPVMPNRAAIPTPMQHQQATPRPIQVQQHQQAIPRPPIQLLQHPATPRPIQVQQHQAAPRPFQVQAVRPIQMQTVRPMYSQNMRPVQLLRQDQQPQESMQTPPPPTTLRYYR